MKRASRAKAGLRNAAAQDAAAVAAEAIAAVTASASRMRIIAKPRASLANLAGDALGIFAFRRSTGIRDELSVLRRHKFAEELILMSRGQAARICLAPLLPCG